MIGLGRHNGRAIEDDAHLAQSIHSVLTTPKGSLVMQRDYGSDLPAVLDRPINGETIIDLYQAIAEALHQWEPRIDLARVNLVDANAGSIVIELIDTNGSVVAVPDLGEQAA